MNEEVFMNEFIFRAWDKNIDKMFYGGEYFHPHKPKHISESGAYRCRINSEGIVYSIKLSNKDFVSVSDVDGIIINYYSKWEEELLYTDVDLMPYTGLKDKNGKKIFLYDIVILDKWKPKEIVYLNKHFAGYSLGDTDLFLTDYDSERMEVIGNKYETPELLPGAKDGDGK